MTEANLGVASARGRGKGRVLLVTLAAIAGAAAVWWPAHKAYFRYPFMGTPSSVAALANKPDLTPEERLQVELFSFRGRATDVAKATAYFGLGVGALVGLTLGAFASGKSTMVGLLAGSVIGVLAGGIGGFTGQAAFESIHQFGGTITYPQIVWFQSATFGVIGLLIGLTTKVLGHSLRDVALSCVGGALGGIAAAFLFVPLCGLVAPLANTTFIVPDSPESRLFWFALNAAFIGLGIAGGPGLSGKKSAGAA